MITIFQSWISCFNRFHYKRYDLDYNRTYKLVHYHKNPDIQGELCHIHRKDSFLGSKQNHDIIFISEKITKLIRGPEFHMVEENSQDYHILDDFR